MWGTYGGGLYEARVGQSDVQRVPTYPADVPQTNWLLGFAVLAATAYLAHRYMGRGGKRK